MPSFPSQPQHSTKKLNLVEEVKFSTAREQPKLTPRHSSTARVTVDKTRANNILSSLKSSILPRPTTKSPGMSFVFNRSAANSPFQSINHQSGNNANITNQWSNWNPNGQHGIGASTYAESLNHSDIQGRHSSLQASVQSMSRDHSLAMGMSPSAPHPLLLSQHPPGAPNGQGIMMLPSHSLDVKSTTGNDVEGDCFGVDEASDPFVEASTATSSRRGAITPQINLSRKRKGLHKPTRPLFFPPLQDSISNSIKQSAIDNISTESINAQATVNNSNLGETGAAAHTPGQAAFLAPNSVVGLGGPQLSFPGNFNFQSYQYPSQTTMIQQAFFPQMFVAHSLDPDYFGSSFSYAHSLGQQGLDLGFLAHNNSLVNQHSIGSTIMGLNPMSELNTLSPPVNAFHEKVQIPTENLHTKENEVRIELPDAVGAKELKKRKLPVKKGGPKKQRKGLVSEDKTASSATLVTETEREVAEAMASSTSEVLDNSSSAVAMNNILLHGKEKKPKKIRSKELSSKFRGVSKCTKDGRWQARIRVGCKVKYLGRFKTQEEAARCYDVAAIECHKERAVLNFAINPYTNK